MQSPLPGPLTALELPRTTRSKGRDGEGREEKGREGKGGEGRGREGTGGEGKGRIRITKWQREKIWMNWDCKEATKRVRERECR